MVNIEELFKTLNIEQINILKDQIERFNNLKNQERKVVEIKDKIILPQGTLIHGTPCISKSLESISKTGILTGQSVGKEEDGETFYCADFHRVPEDMTLEHYNSDFSYIDGRCPFGKKGRGTLAFIFFPDERLSDLISYDCYRDGTPESEITKKFVNMSGIPIEDKEKASSVLFGIPSNFINGIILGDKYINQETVSFLIKNFPGVFITRNNGELIYKNGDTLEIINLRIKSIQRQIELEQTQEELKMKIYTNETLNKNVNELWKAIAHLEIESIAKIYEQLGYQGDHMESAQQLKERHQIEETKMI